MSPVQPTRVIEDLRELQRLTGSEQGARRVAWTETWQRARNFYRERLSQLGLRPELDEAANLWTYLPGRSERYLLIGSHLDSVPNGGWLDGALGVMAGLEVARAVSGQRRELGLALVDFADEEGARFGRSLFGSSAVSGSIDIDELRRLTDQGGEPLPEVVGRHGVELDAVARAGGRLDEIDAYLELHIEQGQVLEQAGRHVGVVRGVLGIDRFRIVINGQAGHAGATPMRLRRDALMAFADGANEIESMTSRDGGLATVGELEVAPGFSTAVPGVVSFSCDLRHEATTGLSALSDGALAAFRRAASQRDCQMEATRIWRIEPTKFSSRLLELARQASLEVTGDVLELVSGPGHDAVEMARNVPAAMVFAPSRHGLSHVAAEDTEEEALIAAIKVFARTCDQVLDGGTCSQRSEVAA
jgi:N-carbamoyl-L-amino-acid hydrolase